MISLRLFASAALYLEFTFSFWVACASLSLQATSKLPSVLRLSEEYEILDSQQMPAAMAMEGMRFEQLQIADSTAIEWQVRLQSSNVGPSALFENFPSADFVLQLPETTRTQLHWSKGSHGDADDFRPYTDDLLLKQELTFESFGGRSSDGIMPYFNLAGDTGGLIVAIGWTGDWHAQFQVVGNNQVRITAGLKQARFRLSPGEQLRLPSVLIMPYRGSWLHGQNQFRALAKRHLTPTNHPPLELMPVAASVHGMLAFNETTEENLTTLAQSIASLDLPIDTFWLDAGWNEGGFPSYQGNPEPDPRRFPNKLQPVGNAAAAGNLRFLVWFEPERVMRGTWLHKEHPEWLLNPVDTPESLRYQEKDGFLLLNLGNAEARNWMIETVSRCVTEWNISIYRQDFNLYPAYFWASVNSPDQVGLCEVRYINGLYDALDEIQRRHPKLIIDSCAAGGRRMDFEMMRRSVVLWRSDSCWGDSAYPRNVQNMTLGLSHWIPLHGLGAAASDTIALRSGMGACASFAINYRDPNAVQALQLHLDNYLPARRLFLEQFYPLLEYSADPSQWTAFQFHEPVQQQGIVQAFRGVASTETSVRLKLHEVQPKQRYSVVDWDHPTSPRILTGEQLQNDGVEVACPAGQSRAIVLTYRLE